MVVFKQAGLVKAEDVAFARGWLFHALGTGEEPPASLKVGAVGATGQITLNPVSEAISRS
ncbi:hypothetical protein MPPM_2028 [Methylorubrum populi]|uniref:Uncharacterized protein n=1 Tax=Methylorubrum populi TaxID=223967 RepID=A0A160PEP6_9HYPH|nr:hypothetical protein MPPM_2028 [Methylorubrum populi]GLS52481.1 hypothetical protein GCM10007886_06640 [Methylobacterium gregans]